jgi:2-keto-4-pentenoate hydratase/2-oxohepta-3-ene-1,7-dioic acid hydratase in catechol pathway
MTSDRRNFFKTSAIVGGAALSAPMLAGTAQAAAGPGAAAQRLATPEMARRLTVLNYRRDGATRLGVRTNRGVLQVDRAAKAFKTVAPRTTDDLIQQGNQGLMALVEKAIAQGKADLFLDESSVEYAPAVTNPEKIVCVGLNYAKHARETNNPIPKLPILFNKFNNTLNSHNAPVKVSAVKAEKFDYEAELVIVMGKRANDVSEADALSYVFGYATGQDFTARDLQMRSSQWMIGKTNDGFAPIGPHIVTADLVGDPNKLKIEQLVNGEVRQSSNTEDMVFNCAQIISYTSKIFTLEPGDIIFTGTPEGVISGYPADRQVWLKPGDKLETRIEKLGSLHFYLT